MDIITVKKRSPEIKAKKLRRLGFVPCIIFGGNLKESISIQMEEADARKLIRLKREGSKVKLNLDGQVIPVQIKEKEHDTLKDEIVHISFQVLKSDQKVNSVAHIFLKNSDMTGGIPESMLFEVPYSALPEDMIDAVMLDIEGMPVGTVVTIEDIPEFKNEKIDLQVEPGNIILRINDRIKAAKQAAEETEE